MKENPNSTQDTNVTIRLKRFLNVLRILTWQSDERESYIRVKCSRNNPMKENPKRERDTNETIQ